MDKLFASLLEVSLSTSPVILALLVLAPLLQRRYPARWRYLAWLIVAVRLLVPASFTFPQAPVTIRIPAPDAAGESVPLPEAAQTPADYAGEPAVSDSAADSQYGEHTVTRDTPPAPLQIAARIWLGGALLAAVVQAWVYIRFLRRLHYSPREEVPAHIREIWRKTGKKLGLRRLPGIVLCAGTPSPVLTGLLRPVLVLPHDRYTAKELELILHHELVHCRRRDLWYKLTIAITGALHWFNPLVHLMAARAAGDVELSCDDEVVRDLGDSERARYGETILAALPKKWRIEPVMTTSFGSTKDMIKRRLKNLFDRSCKRRGIAAICVTLLLTGAAEGFVAYLPASAATRTWVSAGTASASGEPKLSFQEKLARYRPYGLIYDRAAGTATYNGRRVRLVVDYQADGSNAFDLFWSDNTTDSTLCLQGVRDSAGAVTGIKQMEEAAAREFLEELGDAGKGPRASYGGGGRQSGEKLVYYTMDANYVDAANNITATDKISKHFASDSLKAWLAGCDKAVGAYAHTLETAGGYDTYFYYNGGGRYPWNLTAADGVATLDLYSDNAMVTNDGYYLMHFTSAKAYTLRVNLDDKPLKIQSGEVAAVTNTTVVDGMTTVSLGEVPRFAIQTVSEDIVVTRGGDSFQIRYDAGYGELYVLEDGAHSSGNREITLKRRDFDSPRALAAPGTIHVSIPAGAYKQYALLESSSGNISVSDADCAVLLAESGSGDVGIENARIHGQIIAGTKTGALTLKNNTLQVDATISLTNDTGHTSVTLPPDELANYGMELDTGPDARYTIWGTRYRGGGSHSISENAPFLIRYTSASGTLTVT